MLLGSLLQPPVIIFSPPCASRILPLVAPIGSCRIKAGQHAPPAERQAMLPPDEPEACLMPPSTRSSMARSICRAPAPQPTPTRLSYCAPLREDTAHPRPCLLRPG
ncbi:hypothetical protein ZWY2020_004010 [Hordeum vulgare]|nr:hypothetical protein ZWY2020_004010 [Hordeum vulgare]